MPHGRTPYITLTARLTARGRHAGRGRFLGLVAATPPQQRAGNEQTGRNQAGEKSHDFTAQVQQLACVQVVIQVAGLLAGALGGAGQGHARHGVEVVLVAVVEVQRLLVGEAVYGLRAAGPMSTISVGECGRTCA